MEQTSSHLLSITYEQEHGEDKRGGGGRIRLLVQIVKLELAQDHHKDLQQRLAGILKLFPLIAKVDDEEGKAEGDHHDEKGESALHNPLGDGVEHDAEPAAARGLRIKGRFQTGSGSSQSEC